MNQPEKIDESASYQSMMSEIEAIIKGISSGGVDLDHMVNEVEKGYALIGQMRDKLTNVKLKIEDIKKNHTPETDV